MDIKILEQYTLSTSTTSYTLQVYTDEDGLFRWRVMYKEEKVGSCNQGYKSKSSVYTNLEKQAKVLNLWSKDLPNELEEPIEMEDDDE
jgi:uncharacterized protein YegP (UPF0339 family)